MVGESLVTRSSMSNILMPSRVRFSMVFVELSELAGRPQNLHVAIYTANALDCVDKKKEIYNKPQAPNLHTPSPLQVRVNARTICLA